jgi:hypothetical protein
MTGAEHFDRSLDAVQQALENLRIGLEAGGFATALATYRKMADIVVAQRLVTYTASDTTLDVRFDSIAKTASQIRDVLVAWLRIMEQLGSLQVTVEEVVRVLDPSPQPADATEDLVLNWLRTQRGPQPMSRIRADLSLSGEAASRALGRLVTTGSIAERQVGRRRRWEAISGNDLGSPISEPRLPDRRD